MTRIQTRLYILSIYVDSVANFGYIRALADFGCITIRTSKREFSNNEFYLSPDLYLTVEIQKAQKNWILKEILNYKKIVELDGYNDFLVIAKIKQFLAKNIKDNQELGILDDYIEYMKDFKDFKDSKGLANFDIKKFQLMIYQKLGFSSSGKEMDYHLQQAHYDNDLRT